MMIVDAHLDLAMNAMRGRDPRMPAAMQPAVDGEIATVGLPDLRAGHVGLVCATIFCEPAGTGAGGHYHVGYQTAAEAREQALRQLAWYRSCIDQNLLRFIFGASDLPQLEALPHGRDARVTFDTRSRDAGASPVPGAPRDTGVPPVPGSARDTGVSPVPGASRDTGVPPVPGSARDTGVSPVPGASSAPLPAILLLEGADAIRTPDDLPEWFNAGLRIIGLAWKKTRFAGGTGAPGGLTLEGKTLVKGIDRFGIIHDASHLAEQSFWDLLDLTGRPVIASHSNCRTIVGGGDRHLSDEMIKAIAERGGVIGMNFFDKFLIPLDQHGKRRATLGDVLAHVKHICDLTGSARHVGIGTDMDGGLGREQIPQEIQTSADLPKLADALARHFNDADVNGIMAGNWLSFFARSLTA